MTAEFAAILCLCCKVCEVVWGDQYVGRNALGEVLDLLSYVGKECIGGPSAYKHDGIASADVNEDVHHCDFDDIIVKFGGVDRPGVGPSWDVLDAAYCLQPGQDWA
eukprot:5720215-Ditylum_brightwellii.AAC.1